MKKKMQVLALSVRLAAGSVFAASVMGEELTEAAAETEMLTDAQEGETLLPVLSDLSQPGMTLDKVVILSRHNIRSPLTGEGSMIDEITPHEWFEWTSNPGELSLRGAMLEITMGQYFRLWLEKEGLFPENYIPQDGAVRFYANGLQRTQATAHYFSAGLLPVTVVPVERHVAYDGKDPVFLPLINFTNEYYEADVLDEIAQLGGGEGLSGYRETLDDAFRLLSEVTDMEESEIYSSGKYGNFMEDESTLEFEEGKEPALSGPLSMATSLADALVLQYYEEPDELKASFGHELTMEEWKTIGSVLEMNEKIRFAAPLLAPNLANPMLQELFWEMNAQSRKFSFLCGHDSTIASVLAALGAAPYTLPGAIEPATPIGVKLVFSRWRDEEGETFYKVCLVYQSAEQLRSIEPLSLEAPPMIVPVFFAEAPADADGLIAEKDLVDLFAKKIDALDGIIGDYTPVEMEEAA